MHTLNAVLFDLDGTLADTAPDLVNCLNTLLKQNNFPELAYDDAKTSVSKGSLAMVKHGFGEQHSGEQLKQWQQALLDLYSDNICSGTALFPGMAKALETLENKNIPWGIVTNKPGWLTEPLLKAMQLYERAACVVSGDTLAKRKPDPDTLIYACEQLSLKPEQCIYFGDDQRDVTAANAANMPVVIALYGYIHSSEIPEQWGTPYCIETADQIIPWLNANTTFNGSAS